MSIREEHTVADLRERVLRVIGDISEDDVHVVIIASTGDADEHAWALPAREGRYRSFSPKQRKQIADMMLAKGWTRWDDHWQRLLTAEQLAERDKYDTPLTEEEKESDEDRPPVLDGSLL